MSRQQPKPQSNKTLCRPIALFIPALNGGGAQRVFINLANYFVDLTPQPIHLVLARAEGELIHEVRPEVHLVNLNKGRASRAILALASYLRNERPIVLCSTLNYANVCASIAWRLARRPCRLILREANVIRPPSGTLKKRMHAHALHSLMRSQYPKADQVIAVCDTVGDTLEQHHICKKTHINVLGNPVLTRDLEDDEHGEESNLLPDKRFICAIGRFTEQKGFDVLINALARLPAQDYHILLLGDGPLRERLTEQARQLGIQDRVHMPGFVPHPERFLNRASLFVLSSRWEGFPNVLLEALAAGTPVVSTDCPGAPRDILQDGALGHLVPTDNVPALAKAMDDALRMPKADKSARQARAQDFMPNKIAEQYLARAFNISGDK